MFKKIIGFATALAAAHFFMFANAQAESWDANTIRLVVPYPPGTEPDVLARDLGQALHEETGKVFVVENKPGANTIIGTQQVVSGSSKGDMLLLLDRLAVEANPYLYKKLSYDWEADLKPVSDLATVRLFLGVKKDFPADTYEEFLEYAKNNPEDVLFATGGNGHVTHIGGAILSQKEGLDFTFVPYAGVSPALQGLAAGDVDAALAGGLAFQTYEASGRVKVLALDSDKRSAELFSDVPTVQEVRGEGGVFPSTVFSVFAPSKVSDEVIDEIDAALSRALQRKELIDKYSQRNLEVTHRSPDEVSQLMNEEAEKYKKIIENAKISIE